jgi:hypothetical protein
MRTEPFKALNPLTFYEQGEARRPLIKCTEWTNDRAIPALRANSLVITQLPVSSYAGYGTQTSTSGSSSAQVSGSTQASSSPAAGNVNWVWDAQAGRYRYWNTATQQWVWAP